MQNKPGRLYIQGKCDETLTQLCRDVDWINEFIAVNPKRMEKAGIKLEEEKKQLNPKSKAPVKGGTAKLSPNAKEAQKILPASVAALNKIPPAKKGASPNKGLAAKKQLGKK